MKTKKKIHWQKVIRSATIILFWAGLILICFLNRDKITVEAIVKMTPEDRLIAALVMLVLFAVKSLALFIYGSILYTACGILFPLPMAIAVNLIGTVIMTTVPFFIGKRSGCKIIDRLIKKKPKLSFIREMTYNREFFLAFFIRIIGLLPADMVGMYLGASGMRYNRYILGTLLGLAPAVISFSVIGMSIDDPRSPLFIAAVCFELGLAVLSLVLFIIIRKRRQKKQTM